MGLSVQTELKTLPCPFCKSEDLHFVESDDLKLVRCQGCGSTGPHSLNESIAVQAWNVRTYSVKRKPKSET